MLLGRTYTGLQPVTAVIRDHLQTIIANALTGRIADISIPTNRRGDAALVLRNNQNPVRAFEGVGNADLRHLERSGRAALRVDEHAGPRESRPQIPDAVCGERQHRAERAERDAQQQDAGKA